MFQNLDIARLLLRLTAGLMLFHGVHKLLHGIDGIKALVAGAGLPQFFAYGVYVGEVIAPIMVILGYYTRIGALIMTFTMANAIYLAYRADLFSLGKQGGPVIELPILYLLLSVAVALAGPGKFALNRK